ncbi:MAG: holin family protein [Paracoccaceae bacterium]|jgi:hypothetical protein|nr:holin family protein [Paracoccaceae bacterium]MDP7184130.1 holin family protein [Paracoccaceae bacterium]
MGIIGDVFGTLFGGGRNIVAETAGVFRVNAEAEAERDAQASQAALAQFATEFALARQGGFDRFVDGLNRLPRPMMAFGVIGLFAAAMGDPDWFAARMAGIALVPEPLWWLLGAIVSFYFGARHQAKGQEFRRSVTETVSRAAQAGSGQDGNPALDSWRQDAAR